jgi:preprotein translocase subunit SecA
MKISFGNMTMELNIFQIRKQLLDYDQMNQVCLIEEIMDEVIKESSIEDPLEACLAQFSEDLDLEKLMEQADALLEIAPLVSKKKEETAMPDSRRKNLSLYLIILSTSS